MESKSLEEYRGYTFNYWCKPIPIRCHDWEATHKDYNGPGDPRAFTGESIEDLKQQIDEFEDNF